MKELAMEIATQTEALFPRKCLPSKWGGLCAAVLSAYSATVTPVVGQEIGQQDKIRVCRAAISAIMGRDAATISGKTVSNGIVHTQYTRPSDGTLWQARCKIAGNRVIWASFSGGSQGRWRDNPMDSVIRFKLKANSVEISEKFSGESPTVYDVRVD